MLPQRRSATRYETRAGGDQRHARGQPHVWKGVRVLKGIARQTQVGVVRLADEVTGSGASSAEKRFRFQAAWLRRMGRWFGDRHPALLRWTTTSSRE